MFPLRHCHTPARSACALLFSLMFAFGGCGRPDSASRAEVPDSPDSGGEPKVVEIWIHSGQSWERDVIREFVHEFNSIQEEIRVDLGIIPEAVYHEVIQKAGDAGDLPDLIEFDSPYLAHYVWQGFLVPLDEMIAPQIREDLLPSVVSQGTFQDRLYAAALMESGLALYLNPEKLRAARTRLPRDFRDAWSAEEFEEILATLFQQGGGEPILDLKVNYGNDWYCFAISPVLASAGASLVNLETHRAEGFVNGPAAVEAMTRIQGWFKKGYVDLNEDDRAFVDGRVAISWTGPWEYRRYEAERNSALLLAPLPDFGQGARTAQGSWTWGITSSARHPEAAMRFLEFMLRPDNMLQLTEANGAIPSRLQAIGRSSYFGEGAPLHLFVRQLQAAAVPRPQTPAYPAIMQGFEQAFNRIREGADVQSTLDDLARFIDEDIARNDGYRLAPAVSAKTAGE
jgi:multiple sugar transport system substrate-binding protein